MSEMDVTPFNYQVFNCSHSCETTLCLSGSVCTYDIVELCVRICVLTVLDFRVYVRDDLHMS